MFRGGAGQFRKKESICLTLEMDVTFPKQALQRRLRQAWMESSRFRVRMGEATQRRWGKLLKEFGRQKFGASVCGGRARGL